MAFKLELEPNEKLTLQISFKISEKTGVFNFAVSDRAVYWPVVKTNWPAVKAIVLKDDLTYCRRIRNSEISEVCIRRLSPYGLWILAAIMLWVGLVSAVFMLAPLVSHDPGTHTFSGWQFALIGGGIVMPFVTKGRRGLEVRTQSKNFRWEPPLALDKASKQKIRATIDQIAVACEKSGLRVIRN